METQELLAPPVAPPAVVENVQGKYADRLGLAAAVSLGLAILFQSYMRPTFNEDFAIKSAYVAGLLFMTLAFGVFATVLGKLGLRKALGHHALSGLQAGIIALSVIPVVVIAMVITNHA